MLCRGRGGCALDGGDVGGRRRRRRATPAPAQSVRRRGAARRVLLVCHYVDEVCGRDDFSSPTASRRTCATARWWRGAVAATRGAEALLASASASTASNVPSAADAADAAAAVFEATQDVLGCSARAPTPRASPSARATEAPAARAGRTAPGRTPRRCAESFRCRSTTRAGAARTPRAGGSCARGSAAPPRRTGTADPRRGPRVSGAPSGGGGGERGRAPRRRTEAPGRASDLAVSPPSMTVRCSWTTCCRARARIPPRTRSRAPRRRRRASSAPARRSPTR